MTVNCKINSYNIVYIKVIQQTRTSLLETASSIPYLFLGDREFSAGPLLTYSYFVGKLLSRNTDTTD